MKTLYEMQNGPRNVGEDQKRRMTEAVFKAFLFGLYMLIIATAAVPAVMGVMVSPWFFVIYPALLALVVILVTIGGKKDDADRRD